MNNGANIEQTDKEKLKVMYRRNSSLKYRK